jgi:hypothetical protein
MCRMASLRSPFRGGSVGGAGAGAGDATPRAARVCAGECRARVLVPLLPPSTPSARMHHACSHPHGTPQPRSPSGRLEHPSTLPRSCGHAFPLLPTPAAGGGAGRGGAAGAHEGALLPRHQVLGGDPPAGQGALMLTLIRIRISFPRILIFWSSPLIQSADAHAPLPAPP